MTWILASDWSEVSIMADCSNLTWTDHQGLGGGSSLVWLVLYSAVILLSLVTNTLHILGIILTRRLSSLNTLLILIFVINILDFCVLAFEFSLGPENQFPFTTKSCSVYQAMGQTASFLSSVYLVLFCLFSTNLKAKQQHLTCSLLSVTVLTLLLLVPTLLYSEVAVYPSSARHCVVDMSGVGAGLGLDITRQHITTAIYNIVYKAGLPFWLPAVILSLPLVKIARTPNSEKNDMDLQNTLTFSLALSFIIFGLPHAALISARYAEEMLSQVIKSTMIYNYYFTARHGMTVLRVDVGSSVSWILQVLQSFFQLLLYFFHVFRPLACIILDSENIKPLPFRGNYRIVEDTKT